MPTVDPITTPAPDAQATPDATVVQPDLGAGDQPAKAERPAGFGDTFNDYWNDETGADFGKLSEDFTALQTLKAEHEARLAGVPENLDDYEIALPEGFELPKGMEFELKPDDPMVAAAREFAKQAGLTKDQFKGLVGLHAQAQLAEHNALTQAITAERGKLGSKASERITAVTDRLPAAFAERGIEGPKAAQLANALIPMMFTSAQVEAFEILTAANDGTKLNGGGREAVQPDEISDEDYEKLSLTQRILRNTGLQQTTRKAS